MSEGDRSTVLEKSEALVPRGVKDVVQEQQGRRIREGRVTVGAAYKGV